MWVHVLMELIGSIYDRLLLLELAELDRLLDDPERDDSALLLRLFLPFLFELPEEGDGVFFFSVFFFFWLLDREGLREREELDPELPERRDLDADLDEDLPRFLLLTFSSDKSLRSSFFSCREGLFECEGEALCLASELALSWLFRSVEERLSSFLFDFLFDLSLIHI